MIRLADKNEYDKIAKALESPELLLCFHANKDRNLQCYISENAVILKLNNDFYIDKVLDADEISMFLNLSDINNLFGKKEVIEKLLPYLNYKSIKNYTFCKMQDLLFANKNYNIKTASTMHEYKKTYEFLQSTKTFTLPDFDGYYYTCIKNHNSNFGDVYYIEEKGEIISTASTKFVCDNGAMIFAVATKENMRGKGYAKSVVSEICRNLIKNNKTPYISYMSEKAGNLYKKLGFVDLNACILAEF